MIPSRSASLAAILVAGISGYHADAQIAFTDETAQLSSLGADRTNFHSGVAVGVCDLNGDGYDDIIRFHERRTVSIEYQRPAATGFDHKVFGRTGPAIVWALAVSDFDGNGINDLFLGGDSGGLETWEAISQGAPAYRRSILPDRDIFSQGAVFADINNDGYPDIFVCDDNDDPHKYLGDGLGNFTQNQMAINTFIPGFIFGDPLSSGNYGAIWTDYDNDGDNDMYVSKCRQGVGSSSDRRRINLLFSNNGDGSFTEAATAAGLNDGAQSWSTDFADIDNDGDLDCFIINHNIKPRLMENDGSGVFTEITSAAGISGDLANIFGIQALFRDFDNDGFVDLLVTSSDPTIDHLIFRNDGDSSFTRLNDVLVEDEIGAVEWIQSLATGDLNHDGFLDLYAIRARGFNKTTSKTDLLFLNNGNSNRFLAVQLTGTASNRNGIGARVELIGPWGTQVHEVRGGEGYGITSTFTAHFGLGTESIVPTLRVRWPSGLVDEFTNVAADQFLGVTEGETLGAGDFGTPVVSSSLSASAKEAALFRYRIAASNLPTSFSLGPSAPAGMTVEPASGLIEWTPTAQGLVTLDIIASNPAGSDTETLNIDVGPNELIDALEAGSLPVSTGANPWLRDPSGGPTGDAARSALIGNNAASWMEATVSGPDHLLFTWKVSSEPKDLLRLSLDGAIVKSISGIGDWKTEVLEIPNGVHTVRWEYAKDGTTSAGSDRAWVDGVTLVSTIATPTITSPSELNAFLGVPFSHRIEASMDPVGFSATELPAGLAFDENTGLIYGTPSQAGDFPFEVSATNGAGSGLRGHSIKIQMDLGIALDASDLRWKTGGDARWFLQPNLSRIGGSVAQAGDIGDGQTSWLQTSVIGPGLLSYWWSSSAEASFDRLRFLLNGSENAFIDGNLGWTQRSVSIPKGWHVLRWIYEKDGAGSALFDTGSVDGVVYIATDSDNDSLPDGWELEYFKDLDELASVDTDGDGMINSDELVAGTDPGDPQSNFKVQSITRTSSDEFVIAWQGLADKTYDIQASPNMSDWPVIFGNIAGTGAQMSKTVDGSTHTYWRLIAK